MLKKFEGSGFNENLLVGTKTRDDAGVYKISEDFALCQTVDFITPPVNDPYAFGAISAANSLSDIYAMGGEPFSALNLLCFPEDGLEGWVMEKIIEGALEKLNEAGVVVLGGHSIKDEEPKFGLSVSGKVHPDKIWRNRGLKPGDRLILTKELGTGVLFNKNKKFGLDKAVYDSLIKSTTQLNSGLVNKLKSIEIHACTDITGFGLLGHSSEMLEEKLGINLYFSKLPILKGAFEAYEEGVKTGANSGNKKICQDFLYIDPKLSKHQEQIFLDPQTSGGLLFSVPEKEAKRALKIIRSQGFNNASIIGDVVSVEDGPQINLKV